MYRRKSLKNRRFGSLKVLDFSHRPRNADSYWKCLCVCGKTSVVRAEHLLALETTSCGCEKAAKQKKAITKHGNWANGKATPEWRAWFSMRQRCNNPNNQRYHRYGGRGIKVCAGWAKSFENFLTDIGKRPTDGHSLDRIDNEGDYEPGNVRWATAKEQANNRSNNLIRRVSIS